MPSPASNGNILAFANGDLHAYGLRLSTGRLLWRTALSGIDTMASATLDGNRLFIGLCHNMPHFRETLALDIRTGRILWKNPNGSCDASPAVDNGMLFVDGNNEDEGLRYEPGGRDIVSAIDEKSGRTRWTHASPPAPYSIVASGEHAIAGTAVDGVLYQSIVNRNCLTAFDERTGRVRWSAHTIGPVKMSPLVTKASVIFGDTTGILYNVDRRTGVVRRTTSFKDPFSTSPPVIVGGTLLIANGPYIFAIPTDVI